MRQLKGLRLNHFESTKLSSLSTRVQLSLIWITLGNYEPPMLFQKRSSILDKNGKWSQGASSYAGELFVKIKSSLLKPILLCSDVLKIEFVSKLTDCINLFTNGIDQQTVPTRADTELDSGEASPCSHIEEITHRSLI